ASAFSVMPGLDPGIPLRRAQCHPKRDRRDKPGDDVITLLYAGGQTLAFCFLPSSFFGVLSCRIGAERLPNRPMTLSHSSILAPCLRMMIDCCATESEL